MKTKFLIALSILLVGCSTGNCYNDPLNQETVFKTEEISVRNTEDSPNPFWWLYVNRHEKRDRMIIYHPE